MDTAREVEKLGTSTRFSAAIRDVRFTSKPVQGSQALQASAARSLEAGESATLEAGEAQTFDRTARLAGRSKLATLKKERWRGLEPELQQS